MRWKGRRQSDNVDDRRGQSGGRQSSAAAAGILNLVGRRFGVKGIIVLVVGYVVLSNIGLINPEQVTVGGAGTAGPVMNDPVSDERFSFVKVILADTEDIWGELFNQAGSSYAEPRLIVFSGSTGTACGRGSASMGPFYCPADQKVYIDLGFYDELEQSFDAPGDFAQAYVIAHEVGHHVQNLMGTSAKVQARSNQPDYNQYSVRLELQADCYAGIWAHHNERYLDAGDIREALRAANAIGDDSIQGRAGGRVVPHTFTHGTSEQRMRWFSNGYGSGSVVDCDTFKSAYGRL